jgi:menaquinone-specific isochorismate synthase
VTVHLPFVAKPDLNDRDTDGRPAGDYGGGPLIVRSVAIPDPLDLLSQIPVPAAFAWVRHGAGLVGWGEVLRLTLPAGEDRFATAEKWLREAFDGADVRDEVRSRGSGLVAFGSFTFDDYSDGSVLAVPRVVLGRDGHGAAWLTTITRAGQAGDPGRPDPVPLQAPTGITWDDGSLPPAEWEQAVEAAVRRITRGDLRKVVLARDSYATADQPIDERVLLRRLAARYPDCFTFACAGLLGATPELLISRDGREVSALVLAGTMPRGATDAEDAKIAAALLGSAKDNEEHEYAVASMRESLTPLCERLDTAARPELVRLPNLQHLGTPMRGTLSGDPSALALTAAVHPTAAVGGTPTAVAVELIRELEKMDRARYAGPVGWIDASGDGEWCIALRCAQVDGNRARLFAGGGIVAGSVPASELAETNIKLRPMRAALEEDDLSMTDYRAVNRANWDERVPAHVASADYQVARFRKDPGFISEVVRFDLPLLGDVSGLRGVHLQCHIGTDTISLARLGASMTGLDFSGPALTAARELAIETGADATFVQSEVHKAADALGAGVFDLVYTGIGALCWLPDIRRWGSVVASLLRPGGRLLIRDGHPMLWTLDERDDLLVVRYPYFEQSEPLVWDEDGTYVETDASFEHTVTHEWNHGLGEIVTSLLDAGLRISGLAEHDSVPWNAMPGKMQKLADGEWRLIDNASRLPHSFTLQAVKDR